LPQPGRSEQRDELAGRDVEVHAVQDARRAELLHDAGQLHRRAFAGLVQEQVLGGARQGARGESAVVGPFRRGGA
jgi:hypothetical protein